MHPEYESYKKMGGLLGLFVGWWACMDIGFVLSIFMILDDPHSTFPMERVLMFLAFQAVMFLLLARRNIFFRIPFCISACIWIWIDVPYPDFMTFVGICVTPVLSIMYIFCSIRVDVYCGVWKAR